MSAAPILTESPPPPDGAELRDGHAPHAPAPRLCYASALRAIGQDLEARGISSFHLTRWGEGFVVASTEPPAPEKPQGFWGRLFGRTGKPESSEARRVIRYEPRDIERLDSLGRARRGEGGPRPDPFSPTEFLRLVGTDCDRRRVRLLSVIREGVSVTITYAFHTGVEHTETHPAASFQGLSVHEYLRRSDRAKPAP